MKAKFTAYDDARWRGLTCPNILYEVASITDAAIGMAPLPMPQKQPELVAPPSRASSQLSPRILDVANMAVRLFVRAAAEWREGKAMKRSRLRQQQIARVLRLDVGQQFLDLNETDLAAL